MSEFENDYTDERASERLKAGHFDNLPLDALAGELGTPEEWLRTAISHLKVQSSGKSGGTVEVWVGAIHLVLMHLEAIEDGGQPWRAA